MSAIAIYYRSCEIGEESRCIIAIRAVVNESVPFGFPFALRGTGADAHLPCHRLWSQTNCTTARSLAHSDTDFVGFSDAGGGLGGAWLLRMRDGVAVRIPLILDEEIKARQSSLTRACQRPRLSSYFLARSDGWWRFRSNSKDCLSRSRWTCWDALA